MWEEHPDETISEEEEKNGKRFTCTVKSLLLLHQKTIWRKTIQA
jgi:hypothetical protein